MIAYPLGDSDGYDQRMQTVLYRMLGLRNTVTKNNLSLKTLVSICKQGRI
jgi:hypothetical protein